MTATQPTAGLTTGAEVIRVTGSPFYVGSRGVVVETTADRLRVYWHTPVHATPKRTWVARSVVELAR